MGTPIDLNYAGQLCEVTGQIMNEYAYREHREPGVDIKMFDDRHKRGRMEYPLLTTHRLARFYLIGAGDFVYAMGKLLQLEVPMTVSPAALARCAAEYCGAAWALSDPSEDHLTRLSRAERIFSSGLDNSRSDKNDELDALAVEFKQWREQTDLPKVAKMNATALVRDLTRGLSSTDTRGYEYLSRIVHGNAVTLTKTVISAQQSSTFNAEQSAAHALYACWCGISACDRAQAIRGGDETDLGNLKDFFNQVADFYGT
ncbi:MAG: hypothetical protein DI630_16790 [Gordonia sp. (in: high G+C Gram-positive bacteria)]|nr:MAG: hypothetical protein DI630_16790 [Gordonia sp. (in: high G+C Gram-positive bacteria)]